MINTINSTRFRPLISLPIIPRGSTFGGSNSKFVAVASKGRVLKGGPSIRLVNWSSIGDWPLRRKTSIITFRIPRRYEEQLDAREEQTTRLGRGGGGDRFLARRELSFSRCRPDPSDGRDEKLAATNLLDWGKIPVGRLTARMCAPQAFTLPCTRRPHSPRSSLVHGCWARSTASISILISCLSCGFLCFFFFFIGIRRARRNYVGITYVGMHCIGVTLVSRFLCEMTFFVFFFFFLLLLDRWRV